MPARRPRKPPISSAHGSEEIDQRDLLFQQVGRLERIARKAENAVQFSAAVGAITALNRMMALGADQKGFSGHRHNGQLLPALAWQSSTLAQCPMDYKDFCLTCLVKLAVINTVLNLHSQRRR